VPQHPHGMEQQRQIPSFTDSSTKAAESTEDAAKRKAEYYERLIKTIAAERNSARSRCHQAEAIARVQSQRFEQELWFANGAAKSARNRADYEMAKLKEKIMQDYEEVKSSKDTALKDLSEAKAQLATIEKRVNNPPACETCPHLAAENSRLNTTIKFLEHRQDRCEHDLVGAQESITRCHNTIDINDQQIQGLTAEVAEGKAQVTEQKARVSRLNAKLAELQTVPQSLSINAGEGKGVLEELTEHAEAVKHSASGQPLVMRVSVWVGGVDGTDTELALIKMNPDTSFKAVLDDLRRHHPLMALKQKDTGRYIFESDTPAYVSNLLSYAVRVCMLTNSSWASRTEKNWCLSSRTTSQITCWMLPWMVRRVGELKTAGFDRRTRPFQVDIAFLAVLWTDC
jgi:predicted  nucleic acid-binding Zn-ribbon protein